MKVFFVSNTAWNLSNFRLPLMRHLKSKKAEVYAVAPQDETADYLKDEFRFIPIKRLNRNKKSVLRDFKFFIELYSIYRKYKPDLVLHFTIKPNIYGSLACALLKIPSIANVTGLGHPFIAEGFMSYLIKNFYKVSFRFTDKVVFHNHADYELFTTKGVIPPQKGVVVPGSGVDTRRFSPEVCSEFREKESSQSFVFLMVSRILWDKGVKEFVEAGKVVAERHPNTEFWLLGPVDKNSSTVVPRHILSKWQEEGLIKYLGTAKDVRPYICRSDVVVLPSYREGMSKALLEAMAMEKPVIASDVPGCREAVVDGENGFLVKVKDVNSLAKAMENMLYLPKEKLKSMGRNGRKVVISRFSEEIVVRKYERLILSVINNLNSHK